jgi:predicted dehydrogenase
MEAMWTRFLPTFREARRRVEGGSLGLVRQISADLGFPYEETVATASITGDAKGGGALLDLGVYGLSAAHLLLGRPIEIEAQGIRSETGNLRDVAILMRHAGRNGTTEAALSSIRASHGALLSNRLTIAGTTGRIELDAPFIAARGGRERSSTATRDRPPPPSGLRRRLANSPLRGVLRRLGGMDGVAFGGGYPGYGLGLQADEVARCLATGLTESPIMPLDESVAIMETLDQVGRLVARNQR